MNDEIAARISKSRSRLGRLRPKLWNKDEIATNQNHGIQSRCEPCFALRLRVMDPIQIPHLIKMPYSFHIRCLRQICRIKWFDRVTNNKRWSFAKVADLWNRSFPCKESVALGWSCGENEWRQNFENTCVRWASQCSKEGRSSAHC